MKISFFDDEPEIYPLQYGGKARTIINLAKEFTKHDEVEKVTILSRSIVSSKKEFKKGGINFVVLDDDNTFSRIKRECEDTDILNIHCCSFTFPFIESKAKKFYFLHDVLIATADKGSHMDKSLGGNFDYVIAPSVFAKEKYEANKKILDGKNKCVVIPRNINEELFYSVPKEKIINNKNTPKLLKKVIKKYKKILFFPSRPIAEKGGAYMKEVAKQLKKDKACIIGPFDGINKLPKNCINTRWISSKDLKYYYSISDATLNFSELPESFSQICIESVCCKTPIVCFKSGNIPNFSKESNAILLCDKKLESILKKIDEAVKMKKDEQKMEEEKNKILELYKTKIIIEKYIKLYKKCLGGK